MITKTKTFRIQSSDSTVTSLNWVATVSSGCITLDKYNGTINSNDGTVTLVISFTDINCIENQSLTITTTDNYGCTDFDTYTFTNDCNIVGQVSLVSIQDREYTFQASNTGGTSPFTYNWTYDTTVFSGSSTSSTIKLTLIGSTPPDTTLVSVKITDRNGCTYNNSLTYTFTKPTASNVSAVLNCTTNTFTECTDTASFRRAIALSATAYENKTIDWSTLIFTTNTSNLCITNNQDGTIDIFAKSGATTGIRGIKWSVEDNYGLRSSQANLNVFIPVCSNATTDTTLYVPPVITEILDTSPGNVIRVNIEDYVIDAPRIDWTSFDFVAGIGQTKVGPTQLTTNNGNAILDNRQIKYTTGTKTVPVDVVQFNLDDVDGNPLNRSKFYFDAEPTTAPTVNTDTLRVVLGETNTVDLLANDTGIIDVSSVRVVTAPTKGSYTIVNGVLTYTANAGAIGSDTLTYTVNNTNGITSAIATCNITIISAGGSVNTQVCEQGTFNLNTVLSSTKTSGGTFSAKVGNPSGSSVNPTSGVVTFSSATDGNHVFYYTVTSGAITDVATITINFVDYTLISTTETIIPYTGYVYDVRASVTTEGFTSGTVRAFLYVEPTPSSGPVVSGVLQEELTVTFDSANNKFNCSTSNISVGNTYQIQFVGYTPCGQVYNRNTSTMVAS